MSLSPTTGMSRLSLECISATPKDRSRIQPARPDTPMAPSEHFSEASDWEAEDDDDEDDAEIVSSSTGFKYNLSQLSPRTRQVVKELFAQASSHDPPQVSLELCGVREEDPESGGFFYAFQMHEAVPCSVRIGTRDSTRFSAPKCECPDARYRHARPCKHLIWLFDKISKQTLFDHDPESELTLTEFGYPEELGDPFERISEIGLGILANDLHCDTSEPDSDVVPPNPARIREARALVAAVAGIHPGELDDYRPDLEASYNRNALIRRGDLGATLFSLLLASHSLSEWVRSELGPSNPAVDPFRSIQQRVSRIIQELNSHSAAEQDSAPEDAYRVRHPGAEGTRDANWATTQIQHCVRRIEKLVSRGSSPLAGWARSSAARSLISILKAVVYHQDLYAPLVGDRDSGFVHSALDMLADQSQYVEELEEIMERIGVCGAPPSYVANMRQLIARMRSHSSADSVISGGSGVPRSETPPLSEEAPPPALQNPGPSRPSGAQFLTPELPASAMGRRGRGGSGRARGNGKGSKRSVSRSSPQENPRGSRKRARGV